MVSRARKSNPKTKPPKTLTKSLKKHTCKAPTKKTKRSRGSNSKPSLGWSDLPFDLFREISSRLPLKSRYILGFVCTSWSGFVSTTLPPIKPKLSSPWLLSQLNNSYEFLCNHVETKLSFRFGPYPEIEGKICIGSQDGWLILADHILRLSFFNPLSESHVTLPSPTRNNRPAISSTKKVVFSSDPQSPDFVAVIVFYLGAHLRFALWNARRACWRGLFKNPGSKNIYDIFRLERSDRLYAISLDAQLQVLRFDSKAVPFFCRKKDMCTGLHIKKNLYWDWPRKQTPKFSWNNFMVVTKDLKCYEVSRRINKRAFDQPAHVDEISVDCWSDCLCEFVILVTSYISAIQVESTKWQMLIKIIL